jgi:hypothetical protein
MPRKIRIRPHTAGSKYPQPSTSSVTVGSSTPALSKVDQSYQLVVNPSIVSGTQSSPSVYSYKRFVRASTTNAIVQLSGSSRSWVIFDHCIFDPGYAGYANTWNCVTINQYSTTATFNNIYFQDCLFKSIYDPNTGQSTNRMGFECTTRGSGGINYQNIRLIRCTFEPPGSEAISFDGQETPANCLVQDVTILGSGNHVTDGETDQWRWGQGFEINGPTHFTVTNLTIYPGRGSGTNLGGTDNSGIDCNWTFNNINVRPDYHPLQVMTRDASSHPVYAHHMHRSVWTGTSQRTSVGGSGNHVYFQNCDYNDFTGMDWVGSGTFTQTTDSSLDPCTGNTGLVL